MNNTCLQCLNPDFKGIHTCEKAPLGSLVYRNQRRIEDLEGEIKRFKEEYQRACETIAQMHTAAVGEVTGPNRGVVEDVTDLRAERDQFEEGYKSRTKQLDKTLAELNTLKRENHNLRRGYSLVKENKELWKLLERASDLVAEGGGTIYSEFVTFTNPDPARKFNEWTRNYESYKEQKT